MRWQVVALLFAVSSFVETFGFGHLGAFTPLYLQELGVPEESIPLWIGLLTAASFVLGLPLAPLWGVWADRYSRKLIIVRSTLGEGVIFAVFAFAGEAWHLLVARTLVGFILGNTGVMYAMLADVTPRRQLAMAIGVLTAGSTLGMSVGPFLGGWLITRIGISQLYLLDAVICWVAGLLLVLALKERRVGARSTASTLDLLRSLPRNVIESPGVLRLFGLYFVVFLGANMPGPFVPLLVADVYEGDQLPVAIGTAMLVSGLLAAAFSPLAGLLAGRLGAIRVLTVSLAGAAVFGGTQALAADYGLLLVLRGCSGLVQSGMGPLIVSMIAAEVPEERRASVLNITLFPGYLAWLAGGILGSVIGSVSVRGVFAVAAGVVAAGSGMTMLRWRREDRSGVAAS